MIFKKHQNLFFIIFLINLVGCTSGNNDVSNIGAPPGDHSPITDIIEDIINTDTPEIKKVNLEVAQISKEANDDPDYTITKEDEELLLQEGIIEETEIKEWVK